MGRIKPETAIALWDAIFFTAVCTPLLALLLLGAIVELLLMPFERWLP